LTFDGVFFDITIVPKPLKKRETQKGLFDENCRVPKEI
jgi:hypothetical protein